MRKLFAVSLAGAVAGAALVALPQTAAAAAPAAPAAPDAAPVTPIVWGPCKNAFLKQAKARCGFLTVPLDHDNPSGKKIKIAVSRVKNKAPKSKYQGVMLVNPGGPGGSGLGLSTLGSAVPNGAGDLYDWIGFDPRGVGSSVPALTCQKKYGAGVRPPYVPKTRKIERAWLARSESYAKACALNGGELLDHMKTIDVVRDIDLLRRALKAKKINYYGFSYGTYIGQVYATVYTDRVRRMIFDGTVDPRQVWYAANLDQDVAFEKVLKLFFGWVAKYDKTYHLGKTGATVERRWYKEQAALAKKPVARKVGAAEWSDIFLPAGYSEALWPDLADVFASWARKRSVSTLTDAYDNYVESADDNGYAVYLATQCTDAEWPRDWETWRSDNWDLHRTAPFLTWGNAWFNAPCLTWRAEPGTPVEIDGSDVDSLLMINETFDAATPYPGSLHVRSLFPGARLLAVKRGATHSGSLSGNACTDNRIASYLATGALPKRLSGDRADVVCPRLPLPKPFASSAAGGSTAAARGAALGV